MDLFYLSLTLCEFPNPNHILFSPEKKKKKSRNMEEKAGGLNKFVGLVRLAGWLADRLD